MNRNAVKLRTVFEIIASIGNQMLAVLGTLIIWVLLFGLISCPVWFPALIEQMGNK
jgi:hypothetical protein